MINYATRGCDKRMQKTEGERARGEEEGKRGKVAPSVGKGSLYIAGEWESEKHTL